METSLHPWNTKFLWENAIPRSGFLTQQQIDQYNTEGFLLLDDVIPKEKIDDLALTLDQLARETEGFLQTMEDERLSIAESGAILFGIHPSVRFPAAKSFLSSEPFTSIAYDLIGPDVRLYWDQIVYKQTQKPRRFPWHQDNGYGFVEPQQYLTCWVPLVDVDQRNGCPWIVPKVHLNGTLAHEYIEPLGYECFEKHQEAIPVEAKAGSIVIFSSLTPHMTGVNTTSETRKAYILQYAPEGSFLLKGDPNNGQPDNREAANEPDRQFVILKDGLPEV